MKEPSPKPIVQQTANLTALRSELLEMVAKQKSPNRDSKRSDPVEGLVMVIRGK